MKRRVWLLSCAGFTLISIAGCAGFTGANSPNSLKNEVLEAAPLQKFAGRMSLQIEPAAGSAQEAQSFSGSFELRGNAERGELDLLTPLGQIAAQLRWQPGAALLIRGQERQSFASAQALLEQSTGLSLPLEQLFAWLSGQASPSVSVNDWQVDLSAQAQGRILARRQQPTPATLRIILEQP
jgi:outer membrane lipoprotein LolB